MKIDRNKLIEDLMSTTLRMVKQAKELKVQKIEVLNRKSNDDSWSALECIEHLNRYGKFYIPEIQARISKAEKSNNGIFKSGWLGNYFAKSMVPDEHMKPMKTFKSMNPNGSQLDVLVIDEFLSQQQQIVEILEKAKEIDITKTKTALSISKLIRLRLGDTLRVVIYHNERHIEQAKNAVSITY